MSRKGKLFEILRYLSCSVVITIISWGSYAIFINQLNLSVFWGNLFSWLLATSASFFVNKLWVFQSYTWEKSAVLKEFTGFFSARIISGIIEIGGVPILEKISFDKPFYSFGLKLGIKAEVFFTDGIYSKIAVGIIVLILNYVVAKIFVFKNKSKAE